MEEVILVDEQDNEIGLMEKMLAHEKGRLHRAFSVFIFNDQHELLLQQRAKSKYHWPEFWANTCCSHPRKGESIIEAGNRRLREEMGMQCKLEKKFSFLYKATFDNGLIEHEFDHVLVGFSNSLPQPNPDEVMGYKYMKLNELYKEIENGQNKFAPWLVIALEQFKHNNVI